MFQRGWFHLDVRSSELLPELLSVVRQFGPARVAPLGTAVVRELGGDARFAGLIVQLSADTMDWLEALLEKVPGFPVLVLLERGDRAPINQLQQWGVASAVLPLHAANTARFAQRALSNTFVPCARVGAAVTSLASTRFLTAREVQLVSYCLGDEPRALVRRRLGITENTLKCQIRGLLRKCGERNLDALAKNLLRSALLAPESRREPETVLAGTSDVTRPSLSSYALRAQLAAH